MQQVKLRMIRLANDISVKTIAEELGVTTQTYINKEKGVSEFHMTEMFKISKLFNGMPMEEIFLHRDSGEVELFKNISI